MLFLLSSQAMRGFERQADLARAAHVLGIQACAQQRASMKLLQSAMERTEFGDVAPILGALIHGCLPEPSTVGLGPVFSLFNHNSNGRRSKGTYLF